MTAAYTVDTRTHGHPGGDLGITLDLLVNGDLTVPDPYGPERDVFLLEGQRYRAVRWDIEAQVLICWRVP